MSFDTEMVMVMVMVAVNIMQFTDQRMTNRDGSLLLMY